MTYVTLLVAYLITLRFMEDSMTNGKFNHLPISEDGTIGTGVKFQRVRRVTGYLVGTLDRFNDAKRAEEHERVKHLHV